MRVLIVDDSSFFRHRLQDVLTEDATIEVIGTAGNGQEAMARVAELKPDVVTMDVEMPVMDGITAVRNIMAKTPVPILMLSALTTDGANATLDALDAGAVDFFPKQFHEDRDNLSLSPHLLRMKIRKLGRGGVQLRRVPSAPAKAPVAPSVPDVPLPRGVKLLIIGASTGGPAALQQIVGALPASFPIPVLIVQHMPASFTGAFAQRLDRLCALQVKEASDGDELRPGTIYLARGGCHVEVRERRGHYLLLEREPRVEEHYRPGVDIAFESAAQTLGAHVLGLVLTGMGADGREGARHIKAAGGQVWTQDEASCVIYGMPSAVSKAGLSDRELPLGAIPEAILGVR